MAQILGVNLSEYQPEEVRRLLTTSLNQAVKKIIVTPNPEIILKTRHDEELFFILNQADLSLADGFGLQLAGYLSGQKIPRITGADLSLDILNLSADQNKKVVIINRQDGLSSNEEIRQAVSRQWPNLNFLVISQLADQKLTPENQKLVNDFSPDILFCLFGSPWQEKFIYHGTKSLATLKIAIGVGGAFDFITGKQRRAPLMMRNLGLEWLWRLARQPQRLLRIYQAVIVFTIKTLKWRFIEPHLFRKNVACLLYRFNQANQREILIVERQDEKNHWQIPQGGLDGQSPEAAGRRELREEVGTEKFTVEAVYKNQHLYLFKNNIIKYSYKGQKQSLVIARFTGEDKDIKINFWDHQTWRWVKESEFVSSLHPVRQGSGLIYLNKLKQLKYDH